MNKYIGIDDEIGHTVWGDVSDDVVRWVSIEEHDEMIASNYIDLDGRILVDLSDD